MTAAPPRRPAAPRLVILTGAGISRESGLDTFRDPDGIWARVSLEDVATPEGFARDPVQVNAFYNDRRRQLADPAVLPNPAHRALATLEANWPGDFLLVTQNIDDLHERAGSREIRHMHGTLRHARCALCAEVFVCDTDLSPASRCPACGRAGGMRPDIVWFGEIPMHMEEIDAALRRCGLFVSIGTSGAVYPAAGFIARVQGHAETVELNLEPSSGAPLFDRALYGPASTVVPFFVDELLTELAAGPPRTR